MEDMNITFEDLPKAMSWMMDKLNKLDSKIDSLNNIPHVRPADQWMDGRVVTKFHFIKEESASCFLNQK